MKPIIFCLLSCLTAVLASANSVFSPIPSNGVVSGSDGAVVGWGFGVTEVNPNDWLVLTGSSFTGSTLNGSYLDYLSLPTAPLYVAGPAPESSFVTQSWIESSQLGLGEFDIGAVASPGPIDGNIIVHYSVFSQDPNDPNFDPDTDTVIADATFSEPVEIDVLATVPEPAVFGLVLAALAVIVWCHRKDRCLPE
jgi:hypothetical protein